MSIMKEFDKSEQEGLFSFYSWFRSPRRSELLRKIISDFTVISDAEKDRISFTRVIELVKENACLKATSVADDYLIAGF